MNTHLSPSVESDAQIRGLRTFAQGLAVDVLAAVGVALTVAIAGGIDWTSAYWVALALAVGKSAVTAVVSYLARKFVPPVNASAYVPRNAPTTDGGA